MTVLQAEVRRRLWTTILESTVQSSLDAEMPPTIHFDKFDTEPPSNSNDDEIADSTTVLQPYSKDECTMTSVQLILLRSLRTRHRIVLLNGITPDIAYAEVLALSSDLTKGLGSCSALAYSGNDSVINSFQRNMLDYLIRRFHRDSEYRSMLKKALEKMIATSAQRIQHGESNVKNHMFLSMIAADAGAIETGDSPDLKIAQSARSSLQPCHDLLRAQSGTASVPWYDHMETFELRMVHADHALEFDIGIFLQDIDFP
ncbi:hypothetical protein LTR37_008694 [Vermiconidia calcicola]|uniref:Uncharacterized protein n=1 Tax=Vermiconidia calcicola TaxID=1690605 RepID=A0ACC3NA16_9PEZI|nr:hypothetical protein LTR37_008694 [Vermiconidia calcicola]